MLHHATIEGLHALKLPAMAAGLTEQAPPGADSRWELGLQICVRMFAHRCWKFTILNFRQHRWRIYFY